MGTGRGDTAPYYILGTTTAAAALARRVGRREGVAAQWMEAGRGKRGESWTGGGRPSQAMPECQSTRIVWDGMVDDELAASGKMEPAGHTKDRMRRLHAGVALLRCMDAAVYTPQGTPNGHTWSALNQTGTEIQCRHRRGQRATGGDFHDSAAQRRDSRNVSILNADGRRDNLELELGVSHRGRLLKVAMVRPLSTCPVGQLLAARHRESRRVAPRMQWGLGVGRAICQFLVAHDVERQGHLTPLPGCCGWWWGRRTQPSSWRRHPPLGTRRVPAQSVAPVNPPGVGLPTSTATQLDSTRDIRCVPWRENAKVHQAFIQRSTLRRRDASAPVAALRWAGLAHSDARRRRTTVAIGSLAMIMTRQPLVFGREDASRRRIASLYRNNAGWTYRVYPNVS
ncbi:hypothetical protein ACCO45_000323 [Purpureocillium lilacinum]|uniref:Uncharacterized protein n=1 Tax=Purpureocillium lilacinum TaxID=33203 RepID=A0ACC4E3V9_PURLI